MDSTDKTEMKTLAHCMNKLQENGFTENFIVKKSNLTSQESEKTYSPEEVRVVNFYRFEGESDPADSAILYAIETKDGKKGTLSDAYGPYADEHVGEFLKKVDDISKKTDPEIRT